VRRTRLTKQSRIYGPDRVVVTDGPDLGQSIEFVRDDGVRVSGIRVVGRVAVT
jgi:hypothetical protein